MHQSKIVSAYAAWVIRNKVAVIATTLVAIALCGVGLAQLGFTNDYRVYFAPDNDQLVTYDLAPLSRPASSVYTRLSIRSAVPRGTCRG